MAAPIAYRSPYRWLHGTSLSCVRRVRGLRRVHFLVGVFMAVWLDCVVVSQGRHLGEDYVTSPSHNTQRLLAGPISPKMPICVRSAIVVLTTLALRATVGGAIVIRGLPVCRARPVIARQSEQPLDEEELQALAGLWRASLDLDDGERELTCHLDVRPRESNKPTFGLLLTYPCSRRADRAASLAGFGQADFFDERLATVERQLAGEVRRRGRAGQCEDAPRTLAAARQGRAHLWAALLGRHRHGARGR